MVFKRIYQGFERLVAAALTIGLMAVVAMAALQFLIGVGETLWTLDTGFTYKTFQGLFERVLAAIIALELAHSVQQMAAGEHGLTQVRTVLLIGVLAVVRKFILLEIEQTSGLFLLGLGTAILALGFSYAAVFWVERGRQSPDGAERPIDRSPF
ncbi:hypothetical protein CCR85_09335 [Rhodothalassium salexigens]|uniref:Uncharacterized membrane protein (DUF373 family) n=1 Tax=Rhodothalassium salexigens DSM 2132 TaxID=1188247 RepID=A0A4R2PEL4_RHOSA|nr:phosphate-starvation-inducible PsiE family protein [Rhodothalassium salexigens]MBB4212258.1 uncharacterized membrane protein (DUF373 family) [Rhodothalassium salexigens DSM 2132]MBK1639045.1 hypothetical protein [Rhodothalassium salexigens DSM 2132]MBK5911688.1 hypothetical protein [Rhodothalassium salexigens]MBK5919723.1 hypothetical protein [Rhodothalassium salexigens]TCP32591.1 uncharacterized membrane protein (DUF373 family) [Rhodothalassium salexigens DSM 2132]